MCSGSGGLQSTERTAVAAAVSSSAPASVEEYVERIPHDKRNIAIKTLTEIADIAEKIQNWELIAHLLGLSDPQVEVIRRNHQHYEEQKLVEILNMCIYLRWYQYNWCLLLL